MAEYGPLKLKLNTPGLLRTFGSPCNLRVLKKFLHGLEKVNLQVLINPRPDYDHRIQRKNPPGPQETFGLSSQFQTYGKKRNRVCRKRNSLQKSIVPKKKSRKATRSHFKKKTDSTKSNKHLERWAGWDLRLCSGPRTYLRAPSKVMIRSFRTKQMSTIFFFRIPALCPSFQPFLHKLPSS